MKYRLFVIFWDEKPQRAQRTQRKINALRSLSMVIDSFSPEEIKMSKENMYNF